MYSCIVVYLFMMQGYNIVLVKMEINYILSQFFYDKVVINKYKSSNLLCQNIYEKNNKIKNFFFIDG